MTTLRSILAGHLRGSAVDALLDELGPEMVERLEVGLLLAEVERRRRGGGVISISAHDGYWYVHISDGPEAGIVFQWGTTPQAALTALLASLEETK